MAEHTPSPHAQFELCKKQKQTNKQKTQMLSGSLGPHFLNRDEDSNEELAVE